MTKRTKPAPRWYWRWVRCYPFEASLVVVTLSQVAALLMLAAAGGHIGNTTLPGGVTYTVAGVFALCAVLLVRALRLGNPGIVATALRTTVAALGMLTVMVLIGGVAAAEVVLLAQIAPYLALVASRACYLEAAWRAQQDTLTGGDTE